jgi:hypothetical protein
MMSLFFLFLYFRAYIHFITSIKIYLSIYLFISRSKIATTLPIHILNMWHRFLMPLLKKKENKKVDQLQKCGAIPSNLGQ